MEEGFVVDRLTFVLLLGWGWGVRSRHPTDQITTRVGLFLKVSSPRGVLHVDHLALSHQLTSKYPCRVEIRTVLGLCIEDLTNPLLKEILLQEIP